MKLCHALVALIIAWFAVLGECIKHRRHADYCGPNDVTKMTVGGVRVNV